MEEEKNLNQELENIDAEQIVDDVSLDDVLKENERLQKELNIQKDLFLRVAAEYDNYRKRTERDSLLIYNDATANAVECMLTVADSLEMASKAVGGTQSDYQKGLELVINQLNASFKKLGVESFGSVGDTFDPDIHNAIAHAEDEDTAENTIVEVFQKGYKLGEKVIRHAMVKVVN
ncbi:MAG: nucleotide exchange factor GrpE [Clostridia bacterium]|nr:nucleotide exchange factor GrpE [Clostridia bacterium]